MVLDVGGRGEAGDQRCVAGRRWPPQMSCWLGHQYLEMGHAGLAQRRRDRSNKRIDQLLGARCRARPQKREELHMYVVGLVADEPSPMGERGQVPGRVDEPLFVVAHRAAERSRGESYVHGFERVELDWI